MKKIFRNLSLGVACTLGLGSVITTGILLEQKQDILVETKAEIYTDSFYVGGVDIIADSDHHVELGEGYAEFNTEINTLTLHNCTYSGEGTSWSGNTAALMLTDFDEDITIVLEGENTFTCTSNDNKAVGFLLCSNHNRKAYIIGNDGSLTVRGKEYGFYCLNAGLIFYSGTLNAISTGRTTDDDTLRYSAGLYIYTAAGDEDSGYLHHYKRDAVINANGGPLSNVPTYGGSYGILCGSVYNLIIDGATINATAGDIDNNNNVDSIGFECSNNDVTVRNNTRLVSKGGEGTAKSYGFGNNDGTPFIVVSNNIKYIEFAGYARAVVNNSRFKNEIAGLFAANFDGSGEVATLGIKKQTVSNASKNLKFQRITADVASFSGDYDGNGHSISITNVDPSDSTIEYSVDNGSNWTTTLPTFIDVGNYSLLYRIFKTNYPIINGTSTVVINVVDITGASVTVTSDPFTYDGNSHKPTVSTTGTTKGGVELVFKYSDSEIGTFTTEIPGFIEVGIHTIYWKATAANHNDVNGSISFEIVEPSPEPTPVPPEPTPVPPEPGPGPEPGPTPEPTPVDPTNSSGLPGWGVALIVVGSVLGAFCLAILALFIFFPRYIVDYSAKKVIRVIYVKKHYDMVLMYDTHLRKVRRHEVDVFRTRKEAEKALNR